MGYSKKYYQENREYIREKARKRHKENYKPRKRKTRIEKGVADFEKLLAHNNITIESA